MNLSDISPSCAPAIIGLRQKSLYSSSDEKNAMLRVAAVARGVDATLPVILGNRVIGWVRGHALSPVVEMIGGLDQMVNAITVNQQYLNQPFTKIAVGINFVIGKWYDFYPIGIGGGTYTGSALTAKQFTDTSPGSLPHGGNVSPFTKVITGGWISTGQITGVWVLYDRVIAYEACTVNGALQNMTNTLTAQRYISAGQQGLRITPTIQTQFGGSANITALAYVDQNGNAGQAVPTTTTLSLDTTFLSAVGPTIPSQLAVLLGGAATANALFLPLAVGDSGVRSITSFTTSASTTGAICFVLCHPIAYLPMHAIGAGSESDWVRQIANLEQIFDGASLHWFLNSTVNADAVVNGAVHFAWA